MNPEQHIHLQPMTIAEIFSASINLYRENFLKLVAIAIPGAVIMLIVYSFMSGYQFGGMGLAIPLGPEGRTGAGAMIFTGMGFSLFLSLVLTSAGTITISERVLDREISIRQAYRCVLDAFFPLFGALILATTVITIGLSILWIPGIIAYAWFCLAPPVVMIEKEGGVGALKRSRALTKDYLGKTLLVVTLFAVIGILLAMIALLLPHLLRNFPGLYFLPSLLSTLLLLLIEPFKMAVTTILYYDLRVRKEGYDLHVMAEELAASSEAGM